MQHRISAGAIIECDGRVLLVRHVRQGAYDFWVCPGGGVEADEPLEAAARREVKEETGLDVAISELLYIEELVSPDCRHVKFWFRGRLEGGRIDTSHPQSVNEHIVEADWLTREELTGKIVFPPVLTGRYWTDVADGFSDIIRLPLRRMDFW